MEPGGPVAQSRSACYCGKGATGRLGCGARGNGDYAGDGEDVGQRARGAKGAGGVRRRGARRVRGRPVPRRQAVGQAPAPPSRASRSGRAPRGGSRRACRADARPRVPHAPRPVARRHAHARHTCGRRLPPGRAVAAERPHGRRDVPGSDRLSGDGVARPHVRAQRVAGDRRHRQVLAAPPQTALAGDGRHGPARRARLHRVQPRAAHQDAPRHRPRPCSVF